MRLILRRRPWRFFLLKNWYSLRRWQHKQVATYVQGYGRYIDIGAITLGYWKEDSNG